MKVTLYTSLHQQDRRTNCKRIQGAVHDRYFPKEETRPEEENQAAPGTRTRTRKPLTRKNETTPEEENETPEDEEESGRRNPKDTRHSRSLHKDPYKYRFIAGASNAYWKELSKLSTKSHTRNVEPLQE